MKTVSQSLLLLSLFGCSVATQNVSRTASTVDVPPANKSEILSQLKRFRGQTEFLNSRDLIRYASAQPSAPRGEGSKTTRDVQESDLFKVGESGSKLLYVLNPYRGLQVISFEDGPSAPKLVGRATTSGYSTNQMYFDAAHKRIVAIDEVWSDEGNGPSVHLLAYDVSNSAAPAIVQDVRIEGTLSDSRMVGNILYVATTLSNGDKVHGQVASFKMAERIVSIQNVELSLPVSSAENMGIVTVQEGQDTKYYLTAVLSQSRWGWWDRQSDVEVLDISSDAGEIKPLMQVSAKGGIRERSQISIKNNQLVVVSNYTSDTHIARVAVETFSMRDEKSEVISKDEAEFRRLSIERQIKNLSGAEREAKLQQLLADSEIGLKGRFVVQSDGTVTKPFADTVITVGDTQGLSASLQDVRFDGDRLYVFWVPQNQVDPLDVFDISHVETDGAKHLGRLQFDGWMERAETLTYQGKHYIVGLGWVVPAVNNENNRRYPQASLFEVAQVGTRARLTQVASLTLDSGHLWTNFNGQDKLIEFRMDDSGKGSILFGAERFENNRYESGGKVIALDLNQVDSGEALAEGAFLKADQSWLRRVFSNPEINKVEALTSTALSTFDAPADLNATGKRDVRALNVLELARNIVGYEVIDDAGIQIINSGSSWYFNSDEGNTLLRKVKTSSPDAEKADALAEVSLKGSYLGHVYMPESKELVVATGISKYSNGVTDSHLFITKVSGSSLKTETIEVNSADLNTYLSSYNVRFEKAANGKILLMAGTQAFQISADRELSSVKLETTNCPTEALKYSTLRSVGGEFFFEYSEDVKEDDRYLYLARNYVVPVSVSSHGFECQKPLNVPGKVVKLTSQEIVTEDNRVTSFEERTTQDNNGNRVVYYPRMERENDLVSLSRGDVATLRDVLEMTNDETNVEIGGDVYLSKHSYSSVRYSSTPFQLKHILTDANGLFMQAVGTAPDVPASMHIEGKFAEANGEFTLLLGDYSKARLVKFSPATMSFKSLRFKALGSDEGYVSEVKLPSYYGNEGAHKNGRDVTLPMGLFGVTQLTVEE